MRWQNADYIEVSRHHVKNSPFLLHLVDQQSWWYLIFIIYSYVTIRVTFNSISTSSFMIQLGHYQVGTETVLKLRFWVTNLFNWFRVTEIDTKAFKEIWSPNCGKIQQKQNHTKWKSAQIFANLAQWEFQTEHFQFLQKTPKRNFLFQVMNIWSWHYIIFIKENN